MNKADVIIIGGGPAGMMAAIQLKRYGIEPILFEEKRLGGLLWNANLVENYPGFPKGIPGPKLVAQFVKQYEQLRLSYRQERILRIDYQAGDIIVESAEKKYAAKTLVIAIGTKPNEFQNGLVSENAKKFIVYEVVRIAGEQNKTIAIVGGGDAAFDYALNLAGKNNTVSIFNRTNQIKALPLLVSRSKQNEKITYWESYELVKIEQKDHGLILTFSSKIGEQKIVADYLIGAIGRSENVIARSSDFLEIEKKLKEIGRFHYVGDVKNGIYRQTAIAIGDGLKAAMEIYQFLQGEVAS